MPLPAGDFCLRQARFRPNVKRSLFGAVPAPTSCAQPGRPAWAGPQPGSFSPVPALAHVLSEPTSGLGALPRDRGHHSDGRLGPGHRRRAWCLCSLVTVRARCSASEVWGADRAPPAPVRPPGAVLRGWRCPGSGVGSSASWLRGLGQPLVFLGCLWVGGVDFLAPGASP